MNDRSTRAAQAKSTTESTASAPQPGKLTQLSQRPYTGAPAATPGTRAPLTAIDPATIGTGPEMPVPGAVPVDDGQGCQWILRNDHKFECISAPPLATDKLHAELDRDAQPEQWQSLFDRTPVHATGGGSSAAVQARGGNVGGKDPLQTAATGVASASDSLPYAPQIQAAFGRHDIGSVRAAVGGPAQKASQALGATAYATGDRVAFAGAPDLHTAAHEAAHVVQQRSGVSVAGGVGRSGDAYEQHADRVADLVVSGKSAESALDEMSGGGSPTKAVQRHDSPNHIEIGDSVTGKGISILGVKFTQGEAAALVDYVGPLAEFQARCALQQAAEAPGEEGKTVGRIQEMRRMLQDGNEDAMLWDELTGGAYSELTKKNEDHFAPGGDEQAPNHSDSFVGWLAEALEAKAEGNAALGRMHLYTAEHYLQDMFSSGHLLAQPDIDVAIDNLLRDKHVLLMIPDIADSVYALGADTIHCYGIDLPGRDPSPLDRNTFKAFAVAAMVAENDANNSLVKSTIRKYVHEQLDTGVEVSSPAHPTPWIMQGDHKLSTDSQKETVAACQQAIADTRDLFAANARAPVEDPIGRAQSLLAHHKPEPTPDRGEKTIAQAIKSGTATKLLFKNAMVEAGVATLAGALDSACGMEILHGTLVRLQNPNKPLGPADDVPDLDRRTRDPDDRFVPEDRPKYIDSRPSNHASASAVQLEEGVDPDPDRDRDDDVDRDKDTEESLVISDAVQGFSALGNVIQAAARNVGDSTDVGCVIRLPVPGTGTALWVVGGFKLAAAHNADGYALSMGGNLGLAFSPSAGVFLSLGTSITLDGKATDAHRAAEMLGFSLEAYIRSFGHLPLGAALPGPALADALFGKDHVYKAVEGMEETASFGATKGVEGGIRVRDPATGLELKGKGGVAEHDEVTSDGEKGKNEVSTRFFFEGELAFGPATFAGTFDVPTKAGDKTGVFTGAAKGMFEVGDERTWIAGLSGAIGTGTSALMRGIASQVRSSPDAAAFVSGLSSLSGTLEASISKVLADATLTFPDGPGESKAGLEAVIAADQASNQVTLTVSTVIETAVEEEVTGNKLEVARKTIAMGPLVLASLK